MATYGPQYAGVYLAVEDLDLAARVESLLSLSDLYDFTRATTGGRLAALGFPWLARDFKPKLNVLYWPTGASRWAQGHFLVTDAQLAVIRPKAYASETLTALPFVLADGANSLPASLYMLPPRPLTPLLAGANGLYLLTLVDARFFWWDQAATVSVTPGTTTWAQLFAAYAAAMGAAITVDAVPAAYLTPPAGFGTAYEYLPPQLDAAARAVGMKVVVDFDSAVKVVSSATAKSLFTANLALNPVVAGGLIDLTTDANSDLASVLPLSVTVVDANNTATPVALASLGLLQYAGAATYAGSPVLRTVLAGAGAQIAALASQIASDWYSWRQARPDVVYEGVCPWTPTGVEDRIEWSHRDDGIYTRVQRPPWNERTDYAPSTSGPGGPTIQRKTLSADSSVTLDPTADWLEITVSVGSNVNLTGLVGGTPDRPLVVTLMLASHASATLTLPATDFTTPNSHDDVMAIGDSRLLRYDDVLASWVILGAVPSNYVNEIINYYNSTLTLDITSELIIQGYLEACGQMDWCISREPDPGFGSVNNYVPLANKVTYLFNSVAVNCTFTGWTAPAMLPDGAVITIINASASVLTLANQNAFSTAANRFLTYTGADLPLYPGITAFCQYDATRARWLVLWAGGTLTVSAVNPGTGDPAAFDVAGVNRIKFDEASGFVTVNNHDGSVTESLQAASGTPGFEHAGTVTTVSQTFSGLKFFYNGIQIQASGVAIVAGGLAVDADGEVIVGGTTWGSGTGAGAAANQTGVYDSIPPTGAKPNFFIGSGHSIGGSNLGIQFVNAGYFNDSTQPGYPQNTLLGDAIVFTCGDPGSGASGWPQLYLHNGKLGAFLYGQTGTGGGGDTFTSGICTALGTAGLTVGTTTISGGTSGGLIWDNGGVVGSTGALALNGVLIGGGAGAAPTAIAAPTSGQILIGGSAPAFQTVSGAFTINSAGVATSAALNLLTAPAADLSINNHKLTSVTDPASPQDAATKNYVDMAVAALDAKDECQAATTTALAANTYANGSAGVGATITLTVAAVLVLDGYTPILNDRILVKNEGTASHNGIYSVTTLGVLGVTQAVLTRTLDFDQPGDGINGAMVYILNGAVNGNTLWNCTTSGTITFGTTSINWSKFLGSTYAGDEVTVHLSGTTFSLLFAPLSLGGTGSDLSATGGANQFVKQSSAGAPLTVGAIGGNDVAAALDTLGGITQSF